jgi:hypothetical protein
MRCVNNSLDSTCASRIHGQGPAPVPGCDPARGQSSFRGGPRGTASPRLQTNHADATGLSRRPVCAIRCGSPAQDPFFATTGARFSHGGSDARSNAHPGISFSGREWLNAQAASGYVVYDASSERFNSRHVPPARRRSAKQMTMGEGLIQAHGEKSSWRFTSDGSRRPSPGNGQGRSSWSEIALLVFPPPRC